MLKIFKQIKKLTKAMTKTICIIILIISVLQIFVLSVFAESEFVENYYQKVTYSINENGDTYGTDAQSLTVGYEADLILAVGENNIVGYAKATDLNDDVSSPLKAQNRGTNNTTKYIPLYSSDGETIIDEFVLTLDAQERVSPKSVVEYMYGSEGYINVNNHYTCTTRSAISDCTNGVRGKTRIVADKKVENGWLGVQVRIYRASDNALVDSSSFKYNSSNVSFLEYDIFHYTIKTKEAYYCKGVVKTWNPDISNYWTTGTFASPNVNPTIINP